MTTSHLSRFARSETHPKPLIRFSSISTCPGESAPTASCLVWLWLVVAWASPHDAVRIWSGYIILLLYIPHNDLTNKSTADLSEAFWKYARFSQETPQMHHSSSPASHHTLSITNHSTSRVFSAIAGFIIRLFFRWMFHRPPLLLRYMT